MPTTPLPEIARLDISCSNDPVLEREVLILLDASDLFDTHS